MRFVPRPRSLTARTALVLLAGLIVVQAGGLTIYAFDRIDLLRIEQLRAMTTRTMFLYRALVSRAPAERRRDLAILAHRRDFYAEIVPELPLSDMPFLPLPIHQIVQAAIAIEPIRPKWRPRGVLMRGSFDRHTLFIALKMPDGNWLAVTTTLPPIRLLSSPGFLQAFLLMTALAAVLTFGAVRRLTLPLRTLGIAAERLGRDVNAPSLPEEGPLEVAIAAAAFNTMAARIRHLVEDRTLLLAAIGHDLRTPITRLKLRAEFIDDEEQRRKILADLDELEAMVGATLAFSRDISSSEPAVALDFAVLVRTVIDETADARPEIADQLTYSGPEHLTLRGRPIALRRAVGNLLGNAVKYGGAAQVMLRDGADGWATLTIDDDGPGIPAVDLDHVFEPFQRGEASRNRETGGSGLGLPIARNIARAHGGDVVLANRSPSGLRASLTLPL